MKKVLMALVIVMMGIGCFADEMECVQLWEGGPYWATDNLRGPYWTRTDLTPAPRVGSEDWSRGDLYWWGASVGYAYSSADGGASYQYNSTDVGFSQRGVNFDSNDPCMNLTYNIKTDAEGYKDDPNALVKAGYTYVPAGSDTQTLTPEHDAATLTLGSGWRIPTKADFENLIANCDCVYSSNPEGVTFTGRGAYAGKSVFFRETFGCRRSDGFYQPKSGPKQSWYWTSTPMKKIWYQDYAHAFRFDQAASPNPTISYQARYFGMRIRPVRDRPPVPKGVTIMIR